MRNIIRLLLLLFPHSGACRCNRRKLKQVIPLAFLPNGNKWLGLSSELCGWTKGVGGSLVHEEGKEVRDRKMTGSARQIINEGHNGSETRRDLSQKPIHTHPRHSKTVLVRFWSCVCLFLNETFPSFWLYFWRCMERQGLHDERAHSFHLPNPEIQLLHEVIINPPILEPIRMLFALRTHALCFFFGGRKSTWQSIGRRQGRGKLSS